MKTSNCILSRWAFGTLVLMLSLTCIPPAKAAAPFANTGSLSDARFYHTATLLSNGKVLVAGGMGNGNLQLSSAELYDPATGTWTATGALSAARRGQKRKSSRSGSGSKGSGTCDCGFPGEVTAVR